tara:strand:+ start:956 stop:1474 length:519 start_codon:yes stop_codon:yes gene_type:complete
MVLPICPICQKQYSNQTLPLILVPCGHGVCESCQDECVQREIVECSLCRKLVASWIPNYDIRGMVKDDDSRWKEELMASIHFLAGEDIDIDDDLKTVAPLLILKAKNIQSTRRFERVFSELVKVMEPNDIFDWIMVLNFNNEKELLPTVNKLIDDKNFLESKKALWVLKLVH